MYFMKAFKRWISDFLSELGIEKEDEEEDSPWDSEVGIVALVSLAAIHGMLTHRHDEC